MCIFSKQPTSSYPLLPSRHAHTTAVPPSLNGLPQHLFIFNSLNSWKAHTHLLLKPVPFFPLFTCFYHEIYYIRGKKSKPFPFICFPCTLSETNDKTQGSLPAISCYNVSDCEVLFSLLFISLHVNSLWHANQFILNSLSLVPVESSILVFFFHTFTNQFFTAVS